MKRHTSILTMMMLAMLSLGLLGCETMGGAGRDIEKAGDSIQDAAR